jgi:hypothetical protein
MGVVFIVVGENYLFWQQKLGFIIEWEKTGKQILTIENSRRFTRKQIGRFHPTRYCRQSYNKHPVVSFHSQPPTIPTPVHIRKHPGKTTIIPESPPLSSPRSASLSRRRRRALSAVHARSLRRRNSPPHSRRRRPPSAAVPPGAEIRPGHGPGFFSPVSGTLGRPLAPIVLASPHFAACAIQDELRIRLLRGGVLSSGVFWEQLWGVQLNPLSFISGEFAFC